MFGLFYERKLRLEVNPQARRACAVISKQIELLVRILLLFHTAVYHIMNFI